MYKIQNFVLVFLLVATWIALYLSIPHVHLFQLVKSNRAVATVKRFRAANNTERKAQEFYDRVFTASHKNEITTKGRILVTTYGE